MNLKTHRFRFHIHCCALLHSQFDYNTIFCHIVFIMKIWQLLVYFRIRNSLLFLISMLYCCPPLTNSELHLVWPFYCHPFYYSWTTFQKSETITISITYCRFTVVVNYFIDTSQTLASWYKLEDDIKSLHYFFVPQPLHIWNNLKPFQLSLLLQLTMHQSIRHRHYKLYCLTIVYSEFKKKCQKQFVRLPLFWGYK